MKPVLLTLIQDITPALCKKQIQEHEVTWAHGYLNNIWPRNAEVEPNVLLIRLENKHESARIPRTLSRSFWTRVVRFRTHQWFSNFLSLPHHYAPPPTFFRTDMILPVTPLSPQPPPMDLPCSPALTVRYGPYGWEEERTTFLAKDG